MPNKYTQEIEIKVNQSQLKAAQLSIEKISKSLAGFSNGKKGLFSTREMNNLTRIVAQYRQLLSLQEKQRRIEESILALRSRSTLNRSQQSALSKLQTAKKAFDKESRLESIQDEFRKSGFISPAKALKMSIGGVNNSLDARISGNREIIGKLMGSNKKGDIAKVKELQKENAKLALSQGAFNMSIRAAGAAANFLKKRFSELSDGVKDTVKAMIHMQSGIATYSSGSLITNATARETKMKYGLTDAQAYGFTQAKSILNISSDEDLMYMNSAQRERLLSYMDRYSQFYNDLESSGTLDAIQEMQLEFTELKNELAMEFLSWIAANKETIMTVIKGIFNFVKFIAELVLNIVRLFGGGKDYDLYSSDASSSGTTNNKTTTVNINANTNNNISGGATTQYQEQSDQQWSTIAKMFVAATE